MRGSSLLAFAVLFLGSALFSPLFADPIDDLAVGDRVTSPNIVLGCPEKDGFLKIIRQANETGADADEDARSLGCHAFDAGTTFVVDEIQGPILIRLHVSGFASFWTSRSLLR
jgi:hypothetical protein